jgi:hypothetical protein
LNTLAITTDEGNDKGGAGGEKLMERRFSSQRVDDELEYGVVNGESWSGIRQWRNAASSLPPHTQWNIRSLCGSLTELSTYMVCILSTYDPFIPWAALGILEAAIFIYTYI